MCMGKGLSVSSVTYLCHPRASHPLHMFGQIIRNCDHFVVIYVIFEINYSLNCLGWQKFASCKQHRSVTCKSGLCV